MAGQILIVDGRTDTSDSLKAPARFLQKNDLETRTLWLGDCISMEGDVRVQDVAIRIA